MKRLLLILALIVASVGAHAQGTWSSVQSVNVAGMTNGHMFYQYVLVGDYSPTSAIKAPMLVYEHENSEGDKCYPNNPSSCATLTASLANGGSGVQDWYNNATFINRYCRTTGGVPSTGCVIVSVAADQTSDPSGITSNFGGYGDSDANPDPNEKGVIAVIQTILAAVNADPNRVYVTGDSQGGIGSQAIGLDYGVNTGLLGHVITATMPFSGAIYRGGLTAPTNAQLGRLQGGGFQFNINGVGDTGTSSNPTLWVEPLWRAITGNTSYPGQPLGGRAGSSPIYVLVDTSLGHDVWDTYRPLPNGQPMLDLLFAQTGSGVTPPPSGPSLTGQAKSVLPSGYLHTSGNQILDGSANNVRLACSNYSNPTASPSNDMSLIRAQGFNCVEVPWYDAVTCTGGTCNFSTLDAIVQAAIASNLRVTFVHQGNEGVNGAGSCATQQANGLWYDQNGVAPWNVTNGTDGCNTSGTVSYAQFKANWVAFASHYKGNTGVIGFDLHNEPTTYGNPACCSTGGGGSGTGQFSVQNGQIIDPNGNLYVPAGINIPVEMSANLITNNAAQPLTTLFPGINHVRLVIETGTPFQNYPTPASMATVINRLTAAKIVTEIDDHSCNGGALEESNGAVNPPPWCVPPVSGAALTTVTNWYTSLAQAFGSNPYVWFSSVNEPCAESSTCSYSAEAQLGIYQQAIYNAVRNTGANNMFQMLAGIGGGNCQTVGTNSSMNPAAYANMTNIVWELHSYFSGPGTQAAGTSQLTGSVSSACGYVAAQSIKSKDGVVPVIFGEWGTSSGTSDGSDAGPFSQAMISVAQNQKIGNTAWVAYAYSSQWQTITPPPTGAGPYSLTGWGQQVKTVIAAAAAAGGGGGGGGTTTVPAAAAAVGYNTMTYGTSIVVNNTVGSNSYPTPGAAGTNNNWYPFTFYGTSWRDIGFTRNSDGSITLDGSGEGESGYGLTTVALNGTTSGNRTSYTGQAFGGGFYAQAVMQGNGPMAFWSNDVETMNGVSIFPAAGVNPWASQSSPQAGYGDWFEGDFAEFDLGSGPGGTGVAYGVGTHNWYNGTCSNGSCNTDRGTNFTKVVPSPLPNYNSLNTYAVLWVPATSTSQGYMNTYFCPGTGCTPVQATHLSWDKYNPANAPPPFDATTNYNQNVTWPTVQNGGGAGTTAFSILDQLHLALIISGYPGYTTKFQSVQVWQRDGTQDLPVIATGGNTGPPAGYQPGTTNWYENPGQDGHFWKLPFQTGANWISSGALITTLHSGTPSVQLAGNFAVPWYIGKSTDPIVTVTDGTRTIQVHMPLGAQIEGPTSSVDQSVGGTDATQPYLVWSISGAKMFNSSGTQITQVLASGTTIRGTYGMSIQDGSGAIMEDAVTGTPGTNNSIGGIQDLELSKILADPNYVIPHMLAFQLDISQAAPGNPGTLAWPLNQGDGGATYTGNIPQGVTIGIPFSTPRPTGKSRGWYALFDQLQQFGMENYNFGAVGGVNLTIYTQNSAYASLVQDLATSWQDLGKNYIQILNYANGVAGAQYSQATAKGATPGSTNVVLAPPLLDLSPTGGATVAPSTFGAWYPNTGYTVTPTFLSAAQTGNSGIGANWGTGNGGDMKAMVEDVGGAIASTNPGALIMVQGIFNNSTLFNGATRGSASLPITAGAIGDLSTIGTLPVTCCTGEVLYAIHDRPTDLSGVAPDTGTSATTMRNTAWGYLETSNKAPVFVSLGASLDNTNGQLTDENAWASGMTQYINGQLSGQGAPAFTGCQEPMGGNWFSFGYLPGQAIDGTLNQDNSNKAGQQTFWSTLLYTQCSQQNSGGGGGGGGVGSTTWNPSDSSSGVVLSGTNLIATTSATGSQSVRSTTSQSAGKPCFAVVATTISPNWDVGISNTSYGLTVGGGLGVDSNGIGFDPRSAGALQGIFYNNAVLSSGTGTSPNGEEELICADLGAKLFWATNATMRGNGFAWNNSATANPATGVGGVSFAGLTCPCFITWNEDEAGVGTLNAAGPFAVVVPAGFAAWQQPVTSGGHPQVLIFGANDNPRRTANDNRIIAFAQPMDLTQ